MMFFGSVIPVLSNVIPAPFVVIPAQAGIYHAQRGFKPMDSRLRGNDELRI